MREETRQDIISAEEMGTKYDEAAKEIWKNREILAPLLKYSVEELKHWCLSLLTEYTITDIMINPFLNILVRRSRLSGVARATCPD